MTKHGLQVALERDKSLPSFSSQEEAERVLFELRDLFRDEIQQLADRCDVPLDFSPDSLKTLERWYFDLRHTEGFAQLGVTQEQFERCMGFYTSFVYTDNEPKFTWIVTESPLVEGKYDIGVTRGLMTVMVSRYSKPLEQKNNKQMQSMFREYKKFTTLG